MTYNFMENIKLFNLQKNTQKKDDKQPDYRISFKEKDTFIEGGACWKKQDKNGNTYLSCKLSDEWKDHTDATKFRRGWHLEADNGSKFAPDEQNDL